MISFIFHALYVKLAFLHYLEKKNRSVNVTQTTFAPATTDDNRGVLLFDSECRTRRTLIIPTVPTLTLTASESRWYNFISK